MLVNLVEQQVGRPLVRQVGGQRTVDDVLAALDTGDEHTHGHRGGAAIATHARREDGNQDHGDDKDDEFLVAAHPAQYFTDFNHVHGI